MWRKKANKDKTHNGSWSIGAKLRQRILATQQKVAGKLNRKSAHWSHKHKVIFLVALCGVLFAGNLVMVNLGPATPTSHAPAVAPTYREWKLPSLSPDFDADDSVAFMKLRSRLLSMIETDSGMRKIAEFQASRPGFLDSVLYVERQIFPTLPPIQLPQTIKTSPHE